MKIAFFINNLEGGGAERVVCTLSNFLRERCGHEISIFVFGGKAAYPLSKGVLVKKLWSGVLAVGPGKILFLPLFALELALRIRKLRPDSVMSFLVRPNLVLILARWLLPGKRINISERCTSQNIYSKGLSAAIMKKCISAFYPQADRVVAISEGVAEGLLSFGVSRERLRVIYNPQNLEEIFVEAKRGRVQERHSKNFSIVMAGRLIASKDYPTMLRALKRLQAWGLRPRLAVLGEGPDRNLLMKLAEDLGVSDQVEWRGWVSNAFEVMAASDLFVFASRFEGFGNVIVEAMACGLPVVSTDCPSGPSEILGGGRYGVLVPVGDSEALAMEIRTLMTHPEIREDFKRKSLERAPDFDVSLIAEKYLEVLQEGISP
jgi:glycosyltransferase involved in cell wall biosynthesis